MVPGLKYPSAASTQDSEHQRQPGREQEQEQPELQTVQALFEEEEKHFGLLQGRSDFNGLSPIRAISVAPDWQRRKARREQGAVAGREKDSASGRPDKRAATTPPGLREARPCLSKCPSRSRRSSATLMRP